MLDNYENSALSAKLKKELRGEVLFDNFSRGRYSTDASIYQLMPVGVVIPAGWYVTERSGHW